MEDLVEFVAKSLAELPDRVEVRAVDPGRLELLVDHSDLGRITGRRGKTAQALRAILRATGGRKGEVELEIAAHSEAAAG